MGTDKKDASAALLGMLGLAVRARKLTCGCELVCDAVRSGRARIVLVASDASANTKKRVFNCCEFYECECREIAVPSERMAHDLGHKGALTTVSLCDPHMIKGIRKHLDKTETGKDTADNGSREV